MLRLMLACTLRALAVPSFLTGTPDGVVGNDQRCLSAEREPVLRESPMRVVMEESDWSTHHLTSAVAAIIIKEHLGYEVVFNVVSGTQRLFERAASADGSSSVDLSEDDGSQLRESRDLGSFCYLNTEVWHTESSKKASAQRYAASTRMESGLGYDGHEGWYTPIWVAKACGAIAYTAFTENRGDAAIRTALEAVGSVIDCPAAGYHSDLSTWCPRSGRMKVLEAAHWSLDVQKEIIINNGFNIAIRQRASLDLEAFIVSVLNRSAGASFIACTENGNIQPFLSYWWEPTPISACDEVERILLPQRHCGHFDAGNGTWKCDFPRDKLVKVMSGNVARRAPLLDEFMKAFSIPDISSLLSDLHNRTAQNELAHDATWNVACAWVRANEHVWSTWTKTRDAVPGWAQVWDPLLFFGLFFAVFLAILALCCLSESLLITGQELRAEGNIWGWPSEFEVGLPVVPWLMRCFKPLRYNAVTRGSSTVGDSSTSVGLPSSCSLLWASSTFYGTLKSGVVNICLLRFGSKALIKEGLTVRISTRDGTMKSGTKEKMPGYGRLDKAELRFEPNSCVAWTSVRLHDTGFWAPELRFQVAIHGTAARGSRRCTCVVWDPDGRWPGRTLRKPKGFGVRRNLAFTIDVLLLVAKFHGWRQESRRLLYCVVDSLYDTVGSNYLFSVYVIGTCIGDGHHVGILYAALVHGLALCFKRCKSWRFAVAGTTGLKFAHKNLVTLKALDASMDPSSPEASASRIFSLHNKIVDESIPAVYTTAYTLLDDLISVTAAPIYIMVMAAFTGQFTLGSVRMILFSLVPLFLMIGLSTYVAVLHKPKAKKDTLEQMAEGHDLYMNHLAQVNDVIPMISAYGPESAYDAAAALHTQGTMAYVRPFMRYDYLKMDTVFLMDALGTGVYTAAMVALVLLHVESKNFGSCAFDLSQLLMHLQLLSRVRSSLLGMGVHIQEFYEGFHFVINLGRYLNCCDTGTALVAHAAEDNLKGLPLQTSCSYPDFLEQMMQPLTMECSGVKLPLCRSWLLSGTSEQTLDFCEGFSRAQGSKRVHVPAFVRVLQMVPDMTMHFEKDIAGFLSAPDLLAFSEPGRFTEIFAEDLMLAVMPASKDRRTRALSKAATSTLHDEMALLQRAQHLVQAFLADPEMLILNYFFAGIPADQCESMLRAALAWQLGGPEAIVRKRALAGGGGLGWRSGVPAWLCQGGGVRRTLLLRMDPHVVQRWKSILCSVPSIDVSGHTPRVVDSNASIANASVIPL